MRPCLIRKQITFFKPSVSPESYLCVLERSLFGHRVSEVKAVSTWSAILNELACFWDYRRTDH